MKTAKPVLGLMGLGLFVLAACSTPTPEVIIVTATPDQPAGRLKLLQPTNRKWQMMAYQPHS